MRRLTSAGLALLMLIRGFCRFFRRRIQRREFSRPTGRGYMKLPSIVLGSASDAEVMRALRELEIAFDLRFSSPARVFEQRLDAWRAQ